jgi:pyruvate/2-oxoglutarate dehydrogenase complex dihydrolipoamide acyltransferase (E2) component
MITVTSLGTVGGTATTPAINQPEVAIIGPNKIVDRPVVDGSFVVVREMMSLSSSFDYRIVDGYDAALFHREAQAADRASRPDLHEMILKQTGNANVDIHF